MVFILYDFFVFPTRNYLHLNSHTIYEIWTTIILILKKRELCQKYLWTCLKDTIQHIRVSIQVQALSPKYTSSPIVNHHLSTTVNELWKKVLKWSSNIHLGVWRDGSAVKKSGCFHRGPGFCSQHPHGS